MCDGERVACNPDDLRTCGAPLLLWHWYICMHEKPDTLSILLSCLVCLVYIFGGSPAVPWAVESYGPVHHCGGACAALPKAGSPQWWTLWTGSQLNTMHSSQLIFTTTIIRINIEQVCYCYRRPHWRSCNWFLLLLALFLLLLFIAAPQRAH